MCQARGSGDDARVVKRIGPALALALAVLVMAPSCGAARHVAVKSGYSWANLAWGWSNGGKDSVTGMKVIVVDPDDESATSRIGAWHAAGHLIECYLNTGSIEDWRADIKADKAAWDAVALRKMPEWDERWVDVRKLDQLKPLVRKRMVRLQALGCDIVEPDNMDCSENDSCWRGMNGVTKGSQVREANIAYNLALADMAHELGMAVMLKNSAEQAAALHASFDGVMLENCARYNECAQFVQLFAGAGKAVFLAEYNGRADTCTKAGASVATKYCKANSGNYLCVSGAWNNCFAADATLPPTEYIGDPPSPTPLPTTRVPTTKLPSAAPTTKPTRAPTTKRPSAAPTTRAPNPTRSPPTPPPSRRVRVPAGTTWANLAFGFPEGGRDISAGAKLVLLDLEDATARRVRELRKRKHLVACSFSAGTSEAWRPDFRAKQAIWDAFSLGVVGGTGGEERWLDVRRAAELAPLMAARIARAAKAGCDLVAPQLVADCYADPECWGGAQGVASGAELRAANVEWAQRIAQLAHAANLAVLYTGPAELLPELPDEDWDGAQSDDCAETPGECAALDARFTANDKAHLAVAYVHSPGDDPSAICDTVAPGATLKYCAVSGPDSWECAAAWSNCFPAQNPLPPTLYLDAQPTPIRPIAAMLDCLQPGMGGLVRRTPSKAKIIMRDRAVGPGVARCYFFTPPPGRTSVSLSLASLAGGSVQLYTLDDVDEPAGLALGATLLAVVGSVRSVKPFTAPRILVQFVPGGADNASLDVLYWSMR
jgi:hypothetical protein